jgi:hypothetical protein
VCSRSFTAAQFSYVTCIVKKNALDQCVTTQDLTYFQRNGKDVCTVRPEDYANCGTSNGPCWCSENTDDHLAFVYKFRADELVDEGNFTCLKACTGATKDNPIVISAHPSCVNVKVNPPDCKCLIPSPDSTQ